MAKFQFRLDNVLKLKNEQKKQVELELAKVQVEKIKTENNLLQIIDSKAMVWNAINSGNNHQVSDFQTDYIYIQALDKDIEAHHKKIERIQRVEVNIRKEVISLYKEQRIIEKLKEKRKIEFEKSVDKKEQNFLDDISQKIHSKN